MEAPQKNKEEKLIIQVGQAISKQISKLYPCPCGGTVKGRSSFGFHPTLLRIVELTAGPTSDNHFLFNIFCQDCGRVTSYDPIVLAVKAQVAWPQFGWALVEMKALMTHVAECKETDCPRNALLVEALRMGMEGIGIQERPDTGAKPEQTVVREGQVPVPPNSTKH